MKKLMKWIIIIALMVGTITLVSAGWYQINATTSVKITKIKDCGTVYWNTTEKVYGDVMYNYTCKTEYFNYTSSPNHAWCWQIWGNGSDPHLVYDHDFHTGDIPSKTIWWNETKLLGFEEVEHSKEECTDTGQANVYLNKSGNVVWWVCGYSAWGDCSLNVENKSLMCDSSYDGNADGICQSGESCFTINITKEGINKVRNEGFHNVLERFDIQCEIQ